MEICRQSPPINLRFDQNSAYRSQPVRCNLSQSVKSSPGFSIGGQMFILGMGYVGQFFAADLKTKGWVVSGSCTSVGKKKKLEELGYEAYVFDANDPQPEILEIVKNHTHLVVSIPPLGGFGDPLLRHKGLVESVLKDGSLQWLAYLSSTGVYGDCGGAWVDEDYLVRPASEHARARLAAEEQWLCLGHNLGISAQVFRLGGIYGPGRSAIDTILKEEPLSKSQKKRLSKKYTSRVHVADICQALHASISKPSGSKIYNIVDDNPAPRMEVFDLAFKLVEGKFPGLGKQYTSSAGEESGVIEKASMGEKRVSNDRMKKELGLKLLHPSYRSGLLPTQFYTAALYATGTTTLLLRTLYYDYFPKWRNGQEKELNQEVEDLIEPLRPSRQPYSAIPIPSGDNREEAPNEVYYYISARSMAASTSSPIRSYPGPVKSVTSADRIGNHSSSCNEANTPNLLKKYFYKPRPIPPSEHGIGSAYGQWSGWMMTVIYIGSRLPQIWLNLTCPGTEPGISRRGGEIYGGCGGLAPRGVRACVSGEFDSSISSGGS
ncbi:hypothetical protein BUALT_Bualt16G0029600 [Buddleja alternifolia]|uniref:NAD-dependent epimerase/dehydratase domain-containing protein n=1 Tax=Buddleja alternifolia TaxID=168488 RepID=A0AAV6W972_9LAMI|nr:hypothetical protein BUALT_Bualt16G0029600 [Buddleja alternifolia]